MSQICEEVHRLFNSLCRFRFPFDKNNLPENGIYVLFETGEQGHKLDRIVRIGTHIGNNQLHSRLLQHFIKENKDRSIFRKNIGRAILNRRSDLFLEYWDLDLTTKKERDKYKPIIDFEKQKMVEHEVTRYLQSNFSFVGFEIEEQSKRLQIESKLISTVSLCDECYPSNTWLGRFSPINKIQQSGLWQVNELFKQPLDISDLINLKSIID